MKSIRYIERFSADLGAWIVEGDSTVHAFIDKRPREATFSDWRMALRRKLNGDTR